MIPQRLTLRNFLCYRQDAPPLDFTGIRLACISGDNGHGKSALLDAITWALWGKARAKTDDELINLQADEMSVEYQFLLRTDLYRVLRMRSRLRGGKTVLELYINGPAGWQNISGDGVRDTERKIVDILRMEYETFINSTYLLQGRADEFTVKAPGQRKQVLADILGLSLYDQLEAKSRDEAKTRAERAKMLGETLRELDAEIARLPEHETACQGAMERASESAASLRAAEEEMRGLRDQKSLLDGKGRQAAELKVRMDQQQGQLADIRRGLVEHERRLAEHEALIRQATEIEAGRARLEEARQESEALGRRLVTLSHLQQEKARLEQVVATERHGVDGARQVLASQLSERRAKASQVAALEARLVEVRVRAAALSEAEARREAARAALVDLKARRGALAAANEQLKTEMLSLRKKMDELSGVDACPLCGTELTPEHREEVRQQYLAEGGQKRAQYDANVAELKVVEARTAEAQQQEAEAAAALRDQAAVQRLEAAAEETLSQARVAASELARLEGESVALNARLADEDYAHEERAKLQAIALQMDALAYDGQAHEAVKRREAELAPFVLRAARLESARQDVEIERAAVGRFRRQVESGEKVLQDDRQKLDGLAADLAGLDAVARQLAQSQAVVDALITAERLARQEMGAAQQKVTTCRQQVEVRKDRAAQESLAREEKAIYDDLARAFGKQGIQAMLIEEALPELEESANQLLGRMTDDRLSVRFESQRDSKKGGTIETLDIRIADEVGTRNYETYSGGEAFRVNFAIRVALSKLLAHRSGARLQTLVIDEGFGTQDAQGRERLVEAITNIQNEFDMILCITHIQELKDAFPVHIEVTKTAAGSQAVVA